MKGGAVKEEMWTGGLQQQKGTDSKEKGRQDKMKNGTENGYSVLSLQTTV